MGEINKKDAGIAGGKGASLGEMTQAEISVPPGFIVLAGAFDSFIEETDINVEIDNLLHEVELDKMHTIENASEKIQTLIKKAEMPQDIALAILKHFDELGTEFVAVRSSATVEDSADAAWAGQLDTYLNTRRENVLEKVQDCWASLFTPRAIFYRFEKYGVETHLQKISVAVVVQKMVNSEKSGIAFSVHPVTEDYNQLIIEAGFGLGEAIVSGAITPDSYVVEKNPRRILDINVSEQNRGLFRKSEGGNEWRDLSEKGKEQVLSGKEIMELSDLILKIESHYGFPCDIEWAYENGKFYIVQSRPITTLSKKIEENTNKTSEFNSEESHYLGRWLQKSLPSSFWVNYSRSKVVEQIYPEYKLSGPIIVDGYFWCKKRDFEYILNDVIEKYRNRTIEIFDENINKIGNELEFKSQELITKNLFKKESLRTLFSFHQDSVSFWWFETILGEVFIEAALRLKVAKTEPEFFELVHSRLRKTWIEKEEMFLIRIAESLIKKNFKSATKKDIEKLMTNDKNFKNLTEDYLNNFNWVGINKWEGEPNSFEKFSERLIEVLGNVLQKNYLDLEILDDKKKNVDPLVKLTIDSAYWRPTCGGLAARFEFNIRDRITILAKKHNLIYEQSLNLTADELIFLEGKSKLPISLEEINNREEGFAMFQDKDTQPVIITKTDDLFKILLSVYGPPKSVDQDNLKGMPAFKGLVKGTARVIIQQSDFKNFKKGDILVTPETNVNFVPLMRQASAIVTERGGITSHAAIVSRELKVPCIVAVSGVMSVIKDGDLVEVDADGGVVKKL